MAERTNGTGNAGLKSAAAAVYRFLSWLGTRYWPWALGVLVWAVVLWLLSSDSTPPTGPEFPFKDKFLHAIYFCGGAFCFVMLLSVCAGRRIGIISAVVWGVIFGAGVGGLDEWHQSFTPGRMGNDLGDLLADTVGGLIGGWLAWRFYRWIRRLLTPAAESRDSGPMP